MLGTIFNWIYCMDISVLLLLLILTTVVFAWLHLQYHKMRWFKLVVGLLLVLFVQSSMISYTSLKNKEVSQIEANSE